MLDRYDELGSLETDKGLICVAQRDGWPMISLSTSFKDHIRRQWGDCLIVKLLGRMISYKVLSDRLHRLWNPKWDWDLVDFSKALVPKVFFEGRWLSVEYEGLKLICFRCGRAGIRGPCVFCPPIDESKEAQAEEGGEEQGAAVDGGGARESTVHPNVADYGPWMIAQSRKPRPNSNPNPQSRPPIVSGDGVHDGSRFDLRHLPRKEMD